MRCRIRATRRGGARRGDQRGRARREGCDRGGGLAGRGARVCARARGRRGEGLRAGSHAERGRRRAAGESLEDGEGGGGARRGRDPDRVRPALRRADRGGLCAGDRRVRTARHPREQRFRPARGLRQCAAFLRDADLVPGRHDRDQRSLGLRDDLACGAAHDPPPPGPHRQHQLPGLARVFRPRDLRHQQIGPRSDRPGHRPRARAARRLAS